MLDVKLLEFKERLLGKRIFIEFYRLIGNVRFIFVLNKNLIKNINIENMVYVLLDFNFKYLFLLKKKKYRKS